MATGIEKLRDSAALEEVFSAGTGVIFKHSQRCWMSVKALEEVQKFLEGHPDVRVWMVEVLRQRHLSDEIAARLEIRHESPQVIVLEDGRVKWHASHGAVRAASLSKALAEEEG
jgi:bacillithiol system protein YtxJ